MARKTLPFVVANLQNHIFILEHWFLNGKFETFFQTFYGGSFKTESKFGCEGFSKIDIVNVKRSCHTFTPSHLKLFKGVDTNHVDTCIVV